MNRPRPRMSGGSSTRRTPLPMTDRSASSMGRPHLVEDRANRFEDVFVTGTTTDVRGDHGAQGFVIDVRIAREDATQQHQEAGGAIAALQGVMVGKSLLERMQLRARGQ